MGKSLGQEDDLKAYVSSDDDDAAYYEQEIGEKPDKDLFSKKSGSSKAFDGGKRFNSKKKGAGRSSKRKFDNENGDRKKSVKKGKKGKVKVFNTEGVGPN